ncbi:septation protein SpoVG family protein [Candidatus Berkelbacteria bacterium]|nr:septation protein SpoVG family protein [Candidatus Berkelbacteria bacterium]
MNQPISEVQITPVKPTNGLVAFASFVLWDALYCGSVAVLTRPQGGYRLLYPTKNIGTRKLDIFHPIGRELGQLIEHEVVSKLEDVMKGPNGRHSTPDPASRHL